jgi:hypothetical protein
VQIIKGGKSVTENHVYQKSIHIPISISFRRLYIGFLPGHR